MINPPSRTYTTLQRLGMFCDSSAAMQIVANPVFHEMTIHFEIDLYFLREKISEGVFKTCKVQSQDNLANVLTKGLCSAEHRKFCDKLHWLGEVQGVKVSRVSKILEAPI
ncbi:hypothetical protein Tco_0557416 [Tanacetum coccineum]